MALAIRPLHPVFAAAVTGLDLRDPPTPALGREIAAVMDRHAVACLPDQAIDDAQQLRFTRLFGEPELAPLVQGRPRAPEAGDRIQHKEIFDVSNLDPRGNMLPADDERRRYSLGNRLWHTDSSFRQLSATYSMLSARIAPADGADTEFADMRAAYDALPEAMKRRLDGLVAEHSIWVSRRAYGYVPTDEEIRLRPPARHKVVRVHPGSGRKTLYIASHIDRIIGWSEDESRALRDELIAFATRPRFVYVHKWRAGDLVIWDNRCTMHRATPFKDVLVPRDMRRTTVREAVAVPA
ncbi:MAG TPA: TauD/TfdA family dioxygenase [Stellaceae bacterium]|nr:TauD/TfdA family dioxygenase [Stellaceae bacterium]